MAHLGFAIGIFDVVPSADGGAYIAGSTKPVNGRWLVGKLTAAGQLDHAFGDEGWAVLPWADIATTIAFAPNGNIVVGGLADENGVSFVSEITAQGRLVTNFGVGGRTRMPSWHDGGVQGVWIEPDGRILALVGGGNMGCWGVVAVTLTPSGQRVPDFTARFQTGLHQADPDPDVGLPIFVGDVTVGPDGFHLMGTAQDNCVGNPRPRPNPTQRVIEIGFGYDGDLDSTFGAGGVMSFDAPMADAGWAMPQADASVLLATLPDHRFEERVHANLRWYRITTNGQLDTSYASRGVDDVPLPYLAGNDADYEARPVPVSNGMEAAVVTLTAKGDVVLLIQVPAR